MTALTRAAAAEWLKLRTLRSTWWFLGGALALMLLVAMLDASDTAAALRAQGGAAGSVDAAAPAMSALPWARVVLGALGLLVMTSEFATRSIMVTLACTPSRTRLLLAKACVVVAAVFAAGVVLAALTVAASAPLLGEYVDLDAGVLGGQLLTMGAHLALVAALALGLGALVRRSAGALTVLFVLLLVLPLVLQEAADPLGAEFLVTAADFTPGPAADRFMAGESVFGLVLAGWAVVAVAAGAWALRARDA
ncbi:hypothetical protein [Pseudonocardia humida]|uniref:ABC-2 type transport system permease protein n=1 Tax=Pseudonocardia humida TaxID=2800819 RepID=A0ABT1A677_9PSEU|nr:hypothetical protein [Pseudonocardia humida]MCO1658532.1 hypothetical protein [Pseudonocardia humida]